ncbi:MAG: transglycosylase SLT domain-containing protein [bacterium]|nr:transglycosylase SLT domain-containing protein [bacterium]
MRSFHPFAACLLGIALTVSAWADPMPGSDDYLAGHAAEQRRRLGDATRAFDQCAEAGGPLAGYARVRSARCRAAGGDPQGGEEELRSLIDGGSADPWIPMAHIELARILSKGKRHAEAGALYAAVVEPSGVMLRWFEPIRWEAAANALKDPATSAQGYDTYVALLKTIRFRKRRLEAAEALAGSSDARHRLLAAEAFVRSSSYREARTVLAKNTPSMILASKDDQAKWAYLSGRVALASGRRDEAYALFNSVRDHYPGTTWARLAHVYYARDLFARGKIADGTSVLERLAGQTGASEELGDLLWWLAWNRREKGHKKDAEKALIRLVDTCEGHGRRDDALLRLASWYGVDRQRDKALDVYAKVCEDYPTTPMAAEAAYQSGRLCERHDKAVALTHYREAAKGPLGDFCAHRAVERVAALGDSTGDGKADPRIGGRGALLGTHAFARRPAAPCGDAWRTRPWSERLAFLAAHGLEEAEWEALQLSTRIKTLEREGPVYNLLADAGLAATAADLMAASDWGLNSDDPTVDRLRVLYPRAYWSEFLSLGRETGLDPYLLLAVGRQESTFRPRIGSSAGAKGVMQLMPSTAEWLAKVEDGVDAKHAARLDHPPSSIRLGTTYLQRMTEKYDGNTVYALAAYNGGPGNVNKWRRRNPGNDMTVFIDAIPFDETRGYVKRVLGNYAAYLSLYAGVPD